MSFRWTPNCCCGEPDNCVPPCIGECKEIYRGISTSYTEAPFVRVDLRDGENTFDTGTCSYFTLRQGSTDSETGLTVYYADPSSSRQRDNHIHAKIESYSWCIGWAHWYFPNNIGLPEYVNWWRGVAGYVQEFGNPDITDGTSPTSMTVYPRTIAWDFGSNVSVLYGYEFTLHGSHVSVAPWDSRWHNSTRSVSWNRDIRLPFDNIAEPIRFCDGQSVELRPVADKKDYYVSLSGSPGWSCSFPYPTTCGMGGDVSPTGVFNANELGDRIDAILRSANAGRGESWMNPGLDYLVVRLYGWASCPPDQPEIIDQYTGDHLSGGWNCPPVCPSEVEDSPNDTDPGSVYEAMSGSAEETYHSTDLLPVSLQFQIGFLQKENGLFEPIVNADVSVSDVEINFGGDTQVIQGDVPRELHDFVGYGPGSTPTIPSYVTGGPLNCRVIFGSADTSALSETSSFGSVGSPVKMPTRWRRTRGPSYWQDPRTHEEELWQHNDDTSNQTRFHGVYWNLASITKCGREFPEYVTGGRLKAVPVAKFRVDLDSAVEVVNLRKLDATFAGGSNTFSYAQDFHRERWYFSGQNSPSNQNRKSYIDCLYFSSGSYERPYIIKPAGKVLRRLVWRLAKPPVMLAARRYPVESESDLFTLSWPQSSPVGRRRTEQTEDNDPPNEWDANHEFDVWDECLIFETDEPGLPLLPWNGYARPGNAYDVDGIVTDYAINHNLTLCEKTVNGDSFMSVTDPGTSQVYYVPTLTGTKLQEVFGRDPSSMTHVWDRGGLSSMRYYFRSPVDVYIHYDFTYLAVWGDEGGS